MAVSWCSSSVVTSLCSCSDKFQQFLSSSTEFGPSCCVAETCTHSANCADDRRDSPGAARGGGGADEMKMTCLCRYATTHATNWGDRTPGSPTPGVPATRALDDKEHFVIKG